MSATMPQQTVPNRSAEFCRNCGRPILPGLRGEPRAFCGDPCRVEHWKVDHGIAQRRIEFTPTRSAIELGRGTKRDRILARLRQGPATTFELAAITVAFSQRMGEAKKLGYQITREDHAENGQEWSVYKLEEAK